MVLTGQSGYFDGVVHRVVFGWAYDSSYPDRAVTIEVLMDGVSIGFAQAGVFRQDLLDNGIGDGRHAFQLALPESIEIPGSIEARIAGSGYRLQPSSPEPVKAELNRPLPAAWKPSNGKHAYPNLFILGAAKCGTTSLHQYLSACPAIAMSNPKEPYFFEAQLERGAAHYFNRHFAHWSGETVVGEARHRNLYLPHVPRRIHEYNPEARLIVILRNPVERAISHWWHWYSRGEEKLALEPALMADLRRIQDGVSMPVEEYVKTLYEGRERELRTYLDSGYYMDQMERYIELFGAKRLHVVLFEELAAHPVATVCRALRFLGLDETQSARIDYPICNRASEGVRQHVNQDVLKWLYAHYVPHNRRLEQFLGRSLSKWDGPLAEKNTPTPTLPARECRYESPITSPNI